MVLDLAREASLVSCIDRYDDTTKGGTSELVYALFHASGTLIEQSMYVYLEAW